MISFIEPGITFSSFDVGAGSVAVPINCPMLCVSLNSRRRNGKKLLALQLNRLVTSADRYCPSELRLCCEVEYVKRKVASTISPFVETLLVSISAATCGNSAIEVHCAAVVAAAVDPVMQQAKNTNVNGRIVRFQLNFRRKLLVRSERRLLAGCRRLYSTVNRQLPIRRFIKAALAEARTIALWLRSVIDWTTSATGPRLRKDDGAYFAAFIFSRSMSRTCGVFLYGSPGFFWLMISFIRSATLASAPGCE